MNELNNCTGEQKLAIPSSLKMISQLSASQSKRINNENLIARWKNLGIWENFSLNYQLKRYSDVRII